MPDKIYTIEEIRAVVEPIAQEFGVERLTLFGSYARGNAEPGSDIDLRIVNKGALRGLFRLAGFQQALEEQFLVPVDVLPTDALDNQMLSRIKSEEVILYERQPTKPMDQP